MPRPPLDQDQLADQAYAHYERAQAAFEAGRLPAARREIDLAVAGFSRSCGAGHPDTLNARVLRGQLAIAAHATAAGLRELLAAADRMNAFRGGGVPVAELAIHADLSASHALRDRGRYRDARRHATRALRRATRALGPRTELVASAHNELGIIGKFAGWFDEAAQHYAAARPIFLKLHGARSRAMATLWHNLGGLEHARGNFKRGEPLARRAVEVGRQVLPARHPELVAHEVAHAALLDGLDRPRESVPIYQRALATYTKVFGRVHYETASTLHNLAAAYDALGQRARGEAAYRECIAIYHRLLGRAHPDVALARHNLGVLYAEAGRSRAARRELAAALAIFANTLGASHPHTRAARSFLVHLGA